MLLACPDVQVAIRFLGNRVYTVLSCQDRFGGEILFDFEFDEVLVRAWFGCRRRLVHGVLILGFFRLQR